MAGKWSIEAQEAREARRDRAMALATSGAGIGIAALILFLFAKMLGM